MVKLGSIILLLYTSCLVAQSLSLSIRSEETPRVNIFLSSVTHDNELDVLMH